MNCIQNENPIDPVNKGLKNNKVKNKSTSYVSWPNPVIKEYSLNNISYVLSSRFKPVMRCKFRYISRDRIFYYYWHSPIPFSSIWNI